MNKKNFFVIICSLTFSVFSSGVINENLSSESILVVHKTPTCSCCKQWVKHIKNNGFIVDTKDHQNLEDIKKTYKIEPQYRSCHTAVSSDSFIFEGHIPGRYIAQFLTENHTNAIGLSVPGMPLGSPGMEVGDRFTPYKVLILFKDGTSEIYGEVNKK